MENEFQYTAQRKKLIEELKVKGINDERVLQAIEKVPRHLFFEPVLRRFAYIDKAYPIAAGQTISQPYTVAFQTQMLRIKPGDRVLEIGTGSGYQCAVLMEMGATVYSIERQKTLFDQTFRFLHELGYRPKLNFGDGYKGWPGFAPFDKVIVTASAPELPAELIDQLKIGGLMIIPVGAASDQEMLFITKTGEADYTTEKVGMFSFVPMLKGVSVN